MQTTSFRRVAYLVDFCVTNGIKDVVISPGSRNAPLIIGFQSHPKINTHLIHDERSAAFYALGIADATKKPVVLTCTSGSALLNYSPAIVEAYYRQVPLLVLSADRPEKLIDQGDGQTIRQLGVFANFCKYQSQFSESDEDLTEIQESCETAFSHLLNSPLGPVHINIPLDEPLYGTLEYQEQRIDPIVLHKIEEVTLNDDLIKIWENTPKKLIIVGQQYEDPAFHKELIALSNDPSVAVLVENTSNLYYFEKFCHCIDRTLALISDEEMNDFGPELLISMGGAVISKRIKAFLRKHKPKHNWRVGEFAIQEDAYQSITATINGNSREFLKQLNQIKVNSISNFGAKWKQKDFQAQEKHQDFIVSAEFSDLLAFHIINDALPDQTVLHMGNSSVVRYCQLFNPIETVLYYSNRGVSGIDGSASTAVGYATQNTNQLNVLVTGDISFFYDSNAFWNQQLTSNLKIVVINNGGGGIFQIIPGPANSVHADTFFAPTSANVQGICEAFGLNYYSVSNASDLSKAVEDFFLKETNDQASVLEVITADCRNAAILEKYFKCLAER